MVDTAPQRTQAEIALRGPLPAFAGLSLMLGLGLLGAGLAELTTLLPSAIGFVACLVLVARGLIRHYPHSAFGLCNAVTLTRAGLVAFLFGPLFAPGTTSPWLIFAVGVAAFALDGVDGWAARRSGLLSAFGARFDMETDAALGAVLALWLLMSGTTGPEVLALGFMRYAFVAASLFWPALRGALPDSLRRKAICVVQIAALIVLICPLTPEVLLSPVALSASALLTLSFAIDVVWLHKAAR